MYTPLFTTLAASPAPSTLTRHTHETHLQETKYYLELFGMVTATIAIIVLMIIFTPIVVRGFATLSRKMRERRRAVKGGDEGGGIELALDGETGNDGRGGGGCE